MAKQPRTPEQNRLALRALITSVKDHDGRKLSQQRAAEIIALASGRPCSVRTMRSWLADDTVPTSTKCPDWAEPLLRDGLIREGLLESKKR
jgi:hypothetical protein